MNNKGNGKMNNRTMFILGFLGEKAEEFEAVVNAYEARLKE